MRILLQFPEGLKQKALELARKYEGEGHEVFLSASPCYGACDLALDEARWIEADKIVHVGHSRFLSKDVGIPVEYIPYYVDIEIDSLEAVLPYIKSYKNIALATTVQHIHQFEEMKSFFERNGKKVFAEQGERAMERGQVLGCDAGAIKKVEGKVDAVVFVGSGIFHPLAIDVKKPVFVFNPYTKKVSDISADRERLKKLRKGAITKAFSCKKFAVLLSTKPGQFNLPQALWAKKELKKRGYECMILVANEFDPMAVGNFMAFDCLINTACPRIADDQEKFGKPLLNIAMLKELFEIADSAKS
ncbi:MAG: diphthamide biosynthesis enzyme Dph2 [Candidatus ainarchaeum sp.]|nr:diphthamide biosynthesis enzyme Dph2 [Candidatus ainarchaeum sp.]